jgi:hypothetical protein
MTVRSAIQIAYLARAVVSRPQRFAVTRLRFDVEFTVTGAVGQALQRVLIRLTTVRSFPAFLAHARAVQTDAVAVTRRMRTVDFLAEFPFVTAHAHTLTVRTLTVSVAIGYLAFVVSQTAILALPAGIALALAVHVVAALVTQHRTYVCASRKFVRRTIAKMRATAQRKEDTYSDCNRPLRNRRYICISLERSVRGYYNRSDNFASCPPKWSRSPKSWLDPRYRCTKIETIDPAPKSALLLFPRSSAIRFTSKQTNK